MRLSDEQGLLGASEPYADDQDLYWIFCFLDDTGAAESPQRLLGAVFRDEHEVAAMKAFGLVLDRALGRRDPGLWRAVSAAASDASRTLNSAVMSYGGQGGQRAAQPVDLRTVRMGAGRT